MGAPFARRCSEPLRVAQFCAARPAQMDVNGGHGFVNAFLGVKWSQVSPVAPSRAAANGQALRDRAGLPVPTGSAKSPMGVTLAVGGGVTAAAKRPKAWLLPGAACSLAGAQRRAAAARRPTGAAQPLGSVVSHWCQFKAVHRQPSRCVRASHGRWRLPTNPSRQCWKACWGDPWHVRISHPAARHAARR